MNFFSRFLMRNRRVWMILRDTVSGVWADGFTHAGNLAFLSLLTLFPFFIVLATVAGTLGRTADGLRAVDAFLRTLPPDVAALVAKPIADVIGVRASNGLLTFGILVTLWTVSGFMETVRAIIREAYKSPTSLPLWRYRLGSVAVIFIAVIVMLVALASQVVLTGVETFVARLMPFADDVFTTLGLSRLVPAVLLFGALYAVFFVLTPKRYRVMGCPMWPGALVTVATWIGTTMGMPWALGLFGGYTLTYGSLAGVIVALLFFYIIGLGLVAGANLNAALAKARQRRLKAVSIRRE
ncbi:YihY/virulence factor BrkB family protein [Sandarakinorhabdus sp. DWP1-3-1]|uniref:YihY/virulence factor BrkB family protein n=1 Tax=Sandarakinorhabdus sp. DWP1-3-1 TaxID=2804627 RepID=UPI003CEF90AE